MGTYDAVFKQTESQALHQGQIFFTEAKEALQAKEYDVSYEKLVLAIEAYRYVLAEKPHDRFSREGVLEAWEALSKLYPISHSIIFPDVIDEVDYFPLPEPNALVMLKTAIVDTLLESDWKKQCNGKYGGTKPYQVSWKQFYFQNETMYEALEHVMDKVTWAVQLGHHQLLKVLLSKHKNINVSAELNEQHETLLEVAIKREDILTVAILIDRGAKIESKGSGKWTPLHWAVHKGNIPIVNLLLEHHVKVNVRGANGLTPLHVAAFEGHLEIVQLLLEFKSKINVFDKRNDASPLHLAAYQGHTTIVELLLEKKAAVDHQDAHKRTLLHWAATYGKPDVVKVLLKYGANVDAVDDIGRTPLHWAAQTGKLDVVRLLVEKGAKLKAEDRFGERPLVVAAFCGHTKEMVYLFDKASRVSY